MLIKSKYTYFLVAILVVVDILAFLYSVIVLSNHNVSYKFIWVPAVLGIMVSGLMLYAHTGLNSKAYSKKFKSQALLIGRVGILASLLLILIIVLFLLSIFSIRISW